MDTDDGDAGEFLRQFLDCSAGAVPMEGIENKAASGTDRSDEFQGPIEVVNKGIAADFAEVVGAEKFDTQFNAGGEENITGAAEAIEMPLPVAFKGAVIVTGPYVAISAGNANNLGNGGELPEPGQGLFKGDIISTGEIAGEPEQARAQACFNNFVAGIGCGVGGQRVYGNIQTAKAMVTGDADALIKGEIPKAEATGMEVEEHGGDYNSLQATEPNE